MTTQLLLRQSLSAESPPAPGLSPTAHTPFPHPLPSKAPKAGTLPQARGRCSGAAPHHSIEVSPRRRGSFAPTAPEFPATPSLAVPAQCKTIPRQPNGKGRDGAAIAMQENSGPVVSHFLPLLAGSFVSHPGPKNQEGLEPVP